MSEKETQYMELLIKTQQDCIEYLKLSLKLVDDKIPALHQAAEMWKARYDALEKQFMELRAQVEAQPTQSTQPTQTI